jgi:cellulose synthase/poly-beta-1,6-N-acetylglucosamine synthase-like glycosyltransferase
MLRFSIIIPAKDAEATIHTCLQAVLKQDRLLFQEDYEVILVDDGSTDGTAALAKGYGVRVIQQANAGPAAARNTGAKAALGEILVFTDADCAPAEDWLTELVGPFNNPLVVGVKGVYRTHQTELAAQFVQLEYQYKYQRMGRLETIDFIDTYSAAYRRDVFLANGGFNPTFVTPSVEDQEFSFRLAAQGCRLVFQPSAAVYHIHDTNLQEYFRRKWQIGYWKAYMLRWMPHKALGDSHTSPSQSWQILLLGTGCAALPLIFFLPGAVWISLTAWLGFVLTTLPFLGYAVVTKTRLAWITPFFLVVRTIALGLGLFTGFLFPPRPKQNVPGSL